jgi:tRNA 2-thiouridine synthesizing protein B
MLHTVHQSPFEANDLEACLRLVSEGDDLLLYENAVIAALAGNDWSGNLAAIVHSGVVVSVLQADLLARGIPVERLAEGLQVIDYDGFVGLVERHGTTQAW